MRPFSRTGMVLLLAAGALMFYGNRKGPCSACRTAAMLVAGEPARGTEELCAHCATENPVREPIPSQHQETWREPVTEPAFAEFKDWTRRLSINGSRSPVKRPFPRRTGP